MHCENLANIDAGASLKADLVIIGSGPAGFAIAREMIGAGLDVLVLESGVKEERPDYDDLNRTKITARPENGAAVNGHSANGNTNGALTNGASVNGASASDRLASKRIEFHGDLTSSWSHKAQPYGVRNRVLGGSSLSWAGKSASFTPLDYRPRDWVPQSGWPFDGETLAPYLDRAAVGLNLGPNCYDDSFWEMIGVEPPKERLSPTLLQSFFWQFARSRINKMDVIRFGEEFEKLDADNIRVLINATVTHIDTDADSNAFTGLEVSTLEGERRTISAKAAVLAAGGIENARLLLASNRVCKNGVGNEHDVVGRYLMDHPGVRIGHFRAGDIDKVSQRFGFFGARGEDRWHMYMHGLTLGEQTQEREELLNCALYMLEQRAADDPWDAIKRLLKGHSGKPLKDAAAIAKSPVLLARGLGMYLFSTGLIPERFKEAVINAMIARFPNFVVREHQRRGVPHKLDDLVIDAITEQTPDRDSRITLSKQTDALGVPVAEVDWRIHDRERRSIVRLGQIFHDELKRVGLPAPELEDWVAENRPEDGVFIDMAHTMGTTRISNDPKTGVVDADCKVHGVEGLYVAGSSVFPTSGHVNPTLMISALAIRLADQLKMDLTH